VSVTVTVEPGLIPAVPELAPPPADLVRRIADGLEFAAVERREIDIQRDWFTRHPDYLRRVFERSARYLYHIAGELDRRDMPADLALLPIVESAYDPFAYSHGRAAGLWQMIPGTARRFGVRQNWWYDGRRDVLDATRAALDYLQFLHDEFDGDWLLAVAAYNSGEGNVRRAIRRNLKAGKPTDFWHLRLPRETSTYVPKLLALSQITAEPARFDLNLPAIEDRPYFEVVPLQGQMDLALLAELAGTGMDEIYALNPGFNRGATDPDGPHRAVVPRLNAPELIAALAGLPATERMRWVRYRIRNGDSLITIARRHDTTVEVVRAANGIRGNIIRAGDYLMIPTATRSLASYSQSVEQRLTRTQSIARGSNRVEHTVRSGDTLWEVARRYGVTTRSLAKWNGMAPGDTLAVGRKLVVWTEQASAPAASPAATTRKIRYTVRRGDSLSRIAQRFRVSVGQLKRWNDLAGARYLQPGQQLTMYVDVTRQSGG
jgi:membrane-bound lytic murein transglycosylase D